MLRRFLSSTAAATAEAGLTPKRYDLLLMIKAGAARGAPVTAGSLRESLDLRQPAVTESCSGSSRPGWSRGRAHRTTGE